jgi:hypothetical protein
MAGIRRCEGAALAAHVAPGRAGGRAPAGRPRAGQPPAPGAPALSGAERPAYQPVIAEHRPSSQHPPPPTPPPPRPPPGLKRGPPARQSPTWQPMSSSGTSASISRSGPFWKSRRPTKPSSGARGVRGSPSSSCSAALQAALPDRSSLVYCAARYLRAGGGRGGGGGAGWRGWRGSLELSEQPQAVCLAPLLLHPLQLAAQPHRAWWQGGRCLRQRRGGAAHAKLAPRTPPVAAGVPGGDVHAVDDAHLRPRWLAQHVCHEGTRVLPRHRRELEAHADAIARC